MSGSVSSKISIAAAIVIVLAFALSLPAAAAVSRDELQEMVDSGTETGLIVALVERDCVDFEVGPEALIELSASIPREVLRAAVDCSAIATRPESKECKAYRAAAANPALADFPFWLSPTKKNPQVVYELTSGQWVDEQSAAGRGGRGFKGTFHLIREHTGKHLQLVDALNAAGIGKFEFDDHSKLDTSAELRVRQNEAVLDACTARAKLHLTSAPEGAEVFVDGDLKGETPLELEMLSGEHRIEIASPTWAVHRETLRLREGETRSLRVQLERLARLAVSSEPAGAVVLVDGDTAGWTPTEVFVEPGDHEVELVQPRHAPHKETVSVSYGDALVIEARQMPVPEGSYCYDLAGSGPVDRGFDALSAGLVGSEMNLVVPLYMVVTSTMGRQLPSTHVVDGKRILFAPSSGKKYEDDPWALEGRELTGWAFGEFASEVLHVPPGPVTVTEVSRKKSAVVVELRHDTGEKNAIYFDFTRNLKQVGMEELAGAMCLPFSRYEG
ncbi:MAG: PEGA domain-containing protein [bacterium]|nr:PEGA domain-containing protein [bacterium]